LSELPFAVEDLPDNQIITLMQFILNNGLVDEAVTVMMQADEELEHGESDDNDRIVEDHLAVSKEAQEPNDAAVEPQAVEGVSQAVNANYLLPGESDGPTEDE